MVVSDQQKGNWAIGEVAAWQRAWGGNSSAVERHLEVHSYPLVPDDAASNITVGDIAVQPSLVGVNRPVQSHFDHLQQRAQGSHCRQYSFEY